MKNIGKSMTTDLVSQLLEQATDILARKEVNDKPIIAVWGTMNAGKSYLLNMLTHHYNTEYFPVNDVRETAELKQFEGESYIFLDTPGLDANVVDDQIAMIGAKKADLVLFVHQPKGELEKIELDFLQKLKCSFGDYADKNIILIISKVDRESQDKIEQIEQKVLEQCQYHLGFTPVSFLISGTRFHKGVKNQKDGLLKASNLEDLKDHIDSLGVNFQAVRDERERVALNELLLDILAAEDDLNFEKKQINENLCSAFSNFNQASAALATAFELKLSEYEKLV